VIGFISGRSPGDPDDVMAAFREGLATLTGPIELVIAG
jgi:hypothetical protein